MTDSVHPIHDALRARGAFDISHDEGWNPLVETLDAELAKISPSYTVRQVKEKFGGLRFYYDPRTDDPVARQRMQELVDAAEEASFKLCQWCGQPGKLREGSWYMTLCDTHNEERERQRAERWT
jgi:hypothetical protein